MSNQLKIAAIKPVTRSPGMVAFLPCFQTVAEGTQCFDRSGVGNTAAFGTDLLASSAWAAANRLTIADNVAGTNRGAPFLTNTQLGFTWATDSLVVAGVVNMAAAPAATRHIVGNGADTSKTGFALRINVTTGKMLPLIYGTGGVIFGTASAATVADGADHHIIALIDGPSRKIHIFIDGVYDATSNGSSVYNGTVGGLDYSAAAGLQSGTPLVIGGQPNTLTNVATTLYSLTPTSTSYAWQVARKTGSPPSNFGDVARRLARTPLQILSSLEWPA